MLIKSHPDEHDDLRAEAVVYGPGAISIGLLDREGRVVGLIRLRVSGAERVAARTRLPLRIRTGDAQEHDLVPVVVYQSHEDQSIQLDGKDHAHLTETRARLLGIAQGAIEARRAEMVARELAFWNPTVPADLKTFTRAA